MVYKREQETGPQVLVASKQIYANHYFDSSLALSGYISLPGTGAARDSYLLYTNRSRADALSGLFSGLKRSLVEHEAIDGLRTILESSRASLNGRGLSPTESTSADEGRSSRGWKVRRAQLFLGLLFSSLLLITAFVAFTIGRVIWNCKDRRE